MGLDVTAASAPLPDAVRASMKWLGPALDVTAKPTPYNLSDAPDAAPFDSVPGIGFNASAAAAAIVPPPGRISGSGPLLSVDPAQNNAFRAINRAWRQGATVAFSGGHYLISGLSADAQEELVQTLALQATRAGGPSPADGRARLVKQPRIGLYQPWTGSMDEGWTRWLFEQYGFSFVTLHPDDFHAPLADKVDVVIIADDARVPIAGEPAGGRGRGASTGSGRAGVTVRPEYAYALTAGDLQAFDRFVRSGGTLVCLNNATAFAIRELKLPVKNVVAGLKPEEFFLRGSLVQVTTDLSQPLMAGMPQTAAIFADSSPVFDTLDGFSGHVLARYQETGSPLLSGYLIGEEHMHGKAAALDVTLDAGHVVLLGFRPEWRDQPFGTFRVLFNAALNVR
jgi:hypothetical protein